MPNFLIYRFAGPLFFFNAAYFAHRVKEVIEEATSKGPVTFFLINAEAIVDMDINAAEMLDELYQFLRSRNIVLGICQAKGHFRKVLLSTHLADREGIILYPTIATVFEELTKKQQEAEAVKTAAAAIEAATHDGKTTDEISPDKQVKKTVAEIAAAEVAAADEQEAKITADEAKTTEEDIGEENDELDELLKKP